MNADSLEHYGVLGMKWGVRRFQNKDGTLTTVGKNRYNKEFESQKKKYEVMGMDSATAEKAAIRNRNMKRFIFVTGAITLTAAAAYGYSKYGRDYFNKKIKSGTMFNRLSISDHKYFQDASYMYKGKHDDILYKGIYGDQLSRNATVYKKTIKVTDNLRVASHKKAQNVLKSMTKDKTFRDDLTILLEKNRTLNGLDDNNKRRLDRAINSIKNGKVNKNVYKMFNTIIPNRFTKNKNNAKLAKNVKDQFYEKMSSLGFDGIFDVNDQKYSGFNAKSATILFGSARNKMYVKSVSELGKDEIQKAARKIPSVRLKDSSPKSVAFVSGILTTYGTLQLYSEEKNNKLESEYVKKYRKDHPKSTLSYQEIVNEVKRKYE